MDPRFFSQMSTFEVTTALLVVVLTAVWLLSYRLRTRVMWLPPVRAAEVPATLCAGDAYVGGDSLGQVVRCCKPSAQLRLKSVSRGLRDAVRQEVCDWSDSYTEMACLSVACEAPVDKLFAATTLTLPRTGAIGVLTSEEGKGVGVLLRHSCKLQHLSLSHNNLGDAGVTYLAAALRFNTTLQSLSLASNEFSDDGATAIASSLHDNHTLTRLNMSENGVGPEVHFRHDDEPCGIGEAGARALAAMLEVNSSLRTLQLASCEVEDVGAHALAAAIRVGKTALTELDLRENQMSELGKAQLRDAMRERVSATLRI